MPLLRRRDHWGLLVASLSTFAAEQRAGTLDDESDLRITSASGKPTSRAISRQASYSGAACAIVSPIRFNFTGTLPSEVATVTISRSAS